MADKTKISWTDATWNPLRGCTRISPGCQNCYAERMAARFSDPWMESVDGKPVLAQPYHGFAGRTPSGPRWTGKVELIESALTLPLKWRKPRRIFVNSMSDTFHKSVHISDQERIFRVMLSAPQHTYQILTKRADVMAERVPQIYHRIMGPPQNYKLPPWIWLGVSVEDQQRADERIPHLLQTPAAVRWVSVEPMLGPVDVKEYFRWSGRGSGLPSPLSTALESLPDLPGLDWVVIGGESGPNARLFDVAAGRTLMQQCQAAGVPTFWKQFGARPFEANANGNCRSYNCTHPDCGVVRYKFKDRAGADPAEWPEWARVQQFPERKDGGR